MGEQKILKEILLKFSSIGGRVFRNNVGTGWVGKSVFINKTSTIKVNPRDVVLRHARPLHSGLCKGSSDLIGWMPVTITKEMVGKKVAVFTAIEIKTSKVRITEEQQNFIDKVNEDGGISFIARSAKDILVGLSKFKERFK